jgi:hypothetical protein
LRRERRWWCSNRRETSRWRPRGRTWRLLEKRGSRWGSKFWRYFWVWCGSRRAVGLFGSFGDHDLMMKDLKRRILTLPGKPDESGSALTRATGDPWRSV